MPRPIHVRVVHTVAAQAPVVYGILSDYHEGHPRILPPSAFAGLSVEEGGKGAGTVIRFGMKSFGRVTWVRASVEEPHPGRVLLERIRGEPEVETRFVVDPTEEGHSRVTIETTWTPRGFRALFERMLGPRFLRRVYREELENLERVALDEARRT
ncbi:MAG: SRPBCC family protein [Gemmatimonadota bacterium]|jgi:hypothetical protein